MGISQVSVCVIQVEQAWAGNSGELNLDSTFIHTVAHFIFMCIGDVERLADGTFICWLPPHMLVMGRARILAYN